MWWEFQIITKKKEGKKENYFISNEKIIWTSQVRMVFYSREGKRKLLFNIQFFFCTFFVKCIKYKISISITVEVEKPIYDNCKNFIIHHDI